MTLSAGPVLVNLWVRDVTGGPPSLCLWEFGPNRCATFPPLPAGAGWRRYQAIVTPDPGTTSLSLFLYAAVSIPGQSAADEYAGVEVEAVPTTTPLIVLATPLHAAVRPPSLLVSGDGYGAGWLGPSHTDHVLVDGLRNGWLGTAIGSPTPIRYVPARWDVLSRWVSLVGLVLLLGLAGSLVPWLHRLRPDLRQRFQRVRESVRR